LLIKQVSEGHGNSDLDEIREVCREVIVDHPGELIENAIKVYTEMVEKLKYYPQRNGNGKE
jgi:hypothetical protein